jgi:mono/diheme cytochrome c family protein
VLPCRRGDEGADFSKGKSVDILLDQHRGARGYQSGCGWRALDAGLKSARFIAAPLLALWVSLAAGAALAAPDTRAGMQIAVKWCARCHVIGDYNRLGGIDSTPSFWLMAKQRDAYLPRLQSFQDRRPHKSMKFQVSAKNVDDLIAYILNLKIPKRRR